MLISGVPFVLFDQGDCLIIAKKLRFYGCQGQKVEFPTSWAKGRKKGGKFYLPPFALLKLKLVQTTF